MAPVIDTGIGSPVAERPNAWAYEGPPGALDTGIGSSPSSRPDVLDAGDTFIPPLWL